MMRVGFVVALMMVAGAVFVLNPPQSQLSHPAAAQTVATSQLTPIQTAIVADLEKQLAMDLVYDPAYTSNGVPKPGTGVCSDVVIRAAKAIKVDLQREISRAVAANPSAYGVTSPDKGIDHRRCRVMIHWFKKHASPVNPSTKFEPGDVVFYRTSGRGMIDHVGVIGREGTLVHHWPVGPVTIQPDPAVWSIAGHFRFKTGT